MAAEVVEVLLAAPAAAGVLPVEPDLPATAPEAVLAAGVDDAAADGWEGAGWGEGCGDGGTADRSFGVLAGADPGAAGRVPVLSDVALPGLPAAARLSELGAPAAGEDAGPVAGFGAVISPSAGEASRRGGDLPSSVRSGAPVTASLRLASPVPVFPPLPRVDRAMLSSESFAPIAPAILMRD